MRIVADDEHGNRRDQLGDARVDRAHERRRRPRLGRDDRRRRPSSASPSSSVTRPAAVVGALDRRRRDTGADVLAPGGVGHAVGEVLQPWHEAAEEGAALGTRLRRVLLAHLLDLLALGEEPPHERAVLLLHLEQHRVRRRERHLLGIGAVHAADERLGEAVEALAAHAAHDEALERLVVALARRDLLLRE